jgi:hypothetical protein
VPTAPSITGARGTGNTNQTNRRPDIRSTILEYQPETTPFVVLLDKVPNESTSNPEFKWFEEDLEPRFDTTSGAITNVATTVAVTNGTYWAQHDLGYVPRTNETFRVVSVAGGNLTVVRGVGQGGTGVAMNSGEELLITGSAQPEGDTSKPARSGSPTAVTSYTQIFREPWELTETWRNSTTFTTPGDEQRQARMKGIEHRKEQEYAFLVNHPSEDLTGSQPRRTAGGARHYITTNVTDVGGAMTEAEFWAALRPIFRYGSREKVILGGSLPISLINQFAANKVQVRQGETTYGLSVQQYITPFGTANILVDYLLEGTTLGSEMIVLDMQYLRRRYLQNRDTHVKTNIQAPDADTYKAELVTEAGIEFGNQLAHGRITNATS